MFRNVLKNLAGGFLMGSADIVPGVSGGTIALVLGIYERLVESIKEASSGLGRLVRGDSEGFKAHLARVEWLFLISLVAGILTAVALLSALLTRQLDERPVILASAFFGLVVGSVVIATRLIRVPHWFHLVVAVSVGGLLFILLGLGETAGSTDPGLLAFLGAGALAICAMILPGISGSLLLVLIGMYGAVIGAVNERHLGRLGVFMAGAIIGLALFSQLLHWSLRHHHDVVLAGLIGLMAGSLRILWPWPDGVDSPVLGAPAADWGKAVVASVVGVAVVVVVSKLGEAKATG